MLNPYPWQQSLWQQLVQLVAQPRVSHALLLHGMSGLGKCDLAKALAAYVLCDSKTESLACGQCRSCHWFLAGSHPDFFMVTVEAKSKVIKVEQLRTLIDSLQKTPQHSSYQLALVQSADAMNHAAANALLKTLEEPLGQVMIILVTDNLYALPATIVSRCQCVHFSATIDDDDTASIRWLEQKIDDSLAVLPLLRAADYAPLRALRYAELDYFSLRDQLLQHLLSIQRGKANPIAPVTDFLKHDLSLLLVTLLHLIADIIRLQHGATSQQLQHIDCFASLQALAQAHDIITLHYYFQSCQRALAAVRGTVTLNWQLLLESLFIEYDQCCQGKDIVT